jgi:hypothetical protein
VHIAVFDCGHGWTSQFLLALGQRPHATIVAVSESAGVQLTESGKVYRVYDADDRRTTRFRALQGFDGADTCVVVLGEITSRRLSQVLEDIEDTCAQSESFFQDLCFSISNRNTELRRALTDFKFPMSARVRIHEVDLTRALSWWDPVSSPYRPPAAPPPIPARPAAALATRARLPEAKANPKATPDGPPAPADGAATHRAGPAPAPVTARPAAAPISPVASLPEIGKSATQLNDILANVLDIDGALGAALVDSVSGMSLARAGTGVNLDGSILHNTEVVRAKLQVVKAMGLNDAIEDILISLGNQHHVIRLTTKNPYLFFLVVLDKAGSNLAMARYKLAEAEAALQT